jgi:hypothetical protein
MGNWIRIKSRGEVDPLAFVLMGASTKRDDASKIGMFGTGSKYAVCLLLRSGAKVRVMSGGREILLEKESIDFRGQKFERLVVVYDGVRHPTSVTLDVGPTWTVWMALRELVANAVDEGMISVDEADEVSWQAGTTSIFVEKSQSVSESWGGGKEILRLDAPLYTSSKGAVYTKLGPDATRIYKNRVLVGKFVGVASLFDYDLHDIPLNEDRRVNQWEAALKAEEMVAETPAASEVVEFVSSRRLKGNSSFEDDFISDWKKPHPAWGGILEAQTVSDRENALYFSRDIEDLNINVRVLPSDWISSLKKYYPEKTLNTLQDAMKKAVQAMEMPLEGRGQKSSLKRAIQIMKRSGMEIDCPVSVVDFKDEAVLGKYDDKAQKILISRRAVGEGLPTTLQTLIEEWAHRKSGASDCTRRFQDFLINQIVAQLRRRYVI